MPESSLREEPTLPTDDAKIELTEQELSRITGLPIEDDTYDGVFHRPRARRPTARSRSWGA
jgi:hypothetical protein